MQQVAYTATLTGVSPMLMHWDNLDAEAKLAEWLAVPENKKLSKPGDDRTPPWKWKGALYNDCAHVAIPSDVLSACLMGGGAKVSTGKGRETYKRYTRSNMLFADPFVEFRCGGKQTPMSTIDALDGTFAEHCAAVRDLGFQLFTKRVRIGQSKHVRVRPRFDDWSIHAEFIVTDAILTHDALTAIFRQAGAFVGIGDWRPSAPTSPGPWGRFETKLTKL